MHHSKKEKRSYLSYSEYLRDSPLANEAGLSLSKRFFLVMEPIENEHLKLPGYPIEQSEEPAIKDYVSELTGFIKRHHSDINAKDTEGNTLLYAAIEKWHRRSIPHLLAALELLIGMGADPCLTNADGQTAIHLFVRLFKTDNNHIVSFFKILQQHCPTASVIDLFLACTKTRYRGLPYSIAETINIHAWPLEGLVIMLEKLDNIHITENELRKALQKKISFLQTYPNLEAVLTTIANSDNENRYTLFQGIMSNACPDISLPTLINLVLEKYKENVFILSEELIRQLMHFIDEFENTYEILHKMNATVQPLSKERKDYFELVCRNLDAFFYQKIYLEAKERFAEDIKQLGTPSFFTFTANHFFAPSSHHDDKREKCAHAALARLARK